MAIVAPASPFDRAAFSRGLAELARLGFEPVHSDAVLERSGYFAGDAAARAADLERAWSDASNGAILAARGGYGSVQLLPLLRPSSFDGRAVPFVGHSDLTSLLSWLVCTMGLVCFHGPHVAVGFGRGREGYDAGTFTKALTSPQPLGPLPADGLEVLRPGEAEGLLVGGNMTTLAASLGTPYAFDPPRGSVLLFDEVGERPYRLDRLLTQFGLAGILRRASAIVFNQLPGCDEPGGTPSARGVVAGILRDFPGPVVYGLPSGHAIGPCLTVPLGVRARVVAAGAEPQFVIEEAAVE